MIFSHNKIGRVFCLGCCFSVLIVLAACSNGKHRPIHIDSERYQYERRGPIGDFKVGKPYKVMGQYYRPRETYSHSETGIASWYGPNFHGKKTANGEVFDKFELTAAHRTLQLPSIVRVTNLENGLSLIVRVNDRGPFKRGRIIDLSEHSAELLGYKNNGTAKVRVQVLEEESRLVAEMAKNGQSTRGVEIAMNEGKFKKTEEPVTRLANLDTVSGVEAPYVPQAGEVIPEKPLLVSDATVPQPLAQQPKIISNAEEITPQAQDMLERIAKQKGFPAHVKEGNLYPNHVVMQETVSNTEIFVQAGSFSNSENAQSLAQKLSSVSQVTVTPTNLNGTDFYRVRLGPMGSVDDADRVLNNLVSSGHNQAVIVVE